MVKPDACNGFQRAMIELIGKDNYRELNPHLGNLRHNAIRLFEDLKAQVVFMQVQAEEVVDPMMTKTFLERGAFVINWTGDKRTNVPRWMIELAPFVSCTAFSNMDDVSELRALGFKSEYLDIGYDPDIYRPNGASNTTCPEIVFMANHFGDDAFPMSKSRRLIAEFLRSKYGDRFGLYGAGWDDRPSDLNDSAEKEASIYRGAKIAINVNHFDSQRYNSDRLLRILGCGAMCLSFRHTEMEQDYEDETHLVYFNDLVELKCKIDFYLTQEEERRRIAENGQALVRNTKTFVNMVRNILKIANHNS